MSFDFFLFYGSSPRLRGTANSVKFCSKWPRFIPAPAGNSALAVQRPAGNAVHPRACGEQRTPRPSCWVTAGSSPRLRGTEHLGFGVGAGDRFIPAPAGNSSVCYWSKRKATVHPRACGEQPLCSWSGNLSTGSSPRLRGTAPQPFNVGPVTRFIPAPAGNSPQIFLPRETMPVHPRACGEQTTIGRGFDR